MDMTPIVTSRLGAKGATGRPVGLLVDFLLERQVS